MMQSSYGVVRHLPGVGIDEATHRITAALAGEGFGILTRIDVAETFRAKLGVEHRPYLILGACNPGLAQRALVAEPAVGLLMPCNVVVTVDAAGDTLVALADARSILAVSASTSLRELAVEVHQSLERALAAI